MDVFYFDSQEMKSVIVYPENCQSCGQCFLHCQGESLEMSRMTNGYGITAGRGLKTFPQFTADQA